MLNKHVFLGAVVGMTLIGAVMIAHRLDLFHDDAHDYDEFAAR